MTLSLSGKRHQLLYYAVGFPPAVAYITNDGQGGKGQVDNACVEGFGGPLTQLGGCFRADGALCRHFCGEDQ